MRHRSIYDTPAWHRARRATLARDGYRCRIGLPGCKRRATCADHVIELEDGGAPYDLTNLQAACKPCNSAKRNRSMSDRVARLGTQRKW